MNDQFTTLLLELSLDKIVEKEILRKLAPFLILYTVHLIDILMSLPYLEFELSPLYHLFGLQGMIAVKLGYPTFLLVLNQISRDEYWRNWIKRSTWLCVAVIFTAILFNLSQSIQVAGAGISVILSAVLLRLAIRRGS